jgi:hypothetical protein
MGILPCTPGLLVSMAIRKDHSFGLDPKYMMLFYDKENVIPREHRQIKMIRDAKLFYDQVASNRTHLLTELREVHRDLCAEMHGEGRYRTEGEEGWLTLAHADAQREAIQLCTDVVSFQGPLPTFDMEDGFDDASNRPASGLRILD